MTEQRWILKASVTSIGVGLILGVLLGLTGCQSITITNYLTVNDSNSTKITVSTDQAKPFDVNRGLTATVPLAGF